MSSQNPGKTKQKSLGVDNIDAKVFGLYGVRNVIAPKGQ